MDNIARKLFFYGVRHVPFSIQQKILLRGAFYSVAKSPGFAMRKVFGRVGIPFTTEQITPVLAEQVKQYRRLLVCDRQRLNAKLLAYLLRLHDCRRFADIGIDDCAKANRR